MTQNAQPRIARTLAPGIELLAYPPPFQAWLTLSNDPDNTTLDGWRELDEVIWQELALPFADSFFLHCHNDAIADQVSVAEHPQILAAHAHDTMHTWGDYTMSEGQVFTRRQAEQGLELLRRHGVAPRIWTDHSDFIGNMLHRNTKGALAEIVDASGHVYRNSVYSLDLVRQAGVRYLWDGSNLTTVIGQDRPLSRGQWYRHQHGEGAKGLALAWADRLASPLMRRLQSPLLSYEPGINRQSYVQKMPDGQRFHLFRRYTHWPLADIDGFGEVIAPAMVERLIAHQGTAVVYTHLGKRRAGRPSGAHIPPPTRQALDSLASEHREGKIQISPTSQLLDFLVLRDALHWDEEQAVLRPDGVRFVALNRDDLAGHQFGFRVVGKTPPSVQIEADGSARREVADWGGHWHELDGGLWRLSFGDGLTHRETNGAPRG